MNMTKTGILASSVLGLELVGALMSLPQVLPALKWYVELNKSPLTPPLLVFAPVWIAIFLLAGIALYFVIIKIVEGEPKNPHLALCAFGAQFLLTLLGPVLLFVAKSLLLASINMALISAAACAAIFLFYKIDKKAGLLLVPYFLWAAYLALLLFLGLPFN